MDPFFARNRLSAYLDGELPSGEAREVEDALAQSPELRAELDSLRAAISLLRQGGPVPAPRGFAQRLESRIAREPLRVGWRRHLYGVRIEVGMLAAAAAIVLVFAAQKPDEPVAEPEAVAAVTEGGAVPAPAIDAAGVAGVEKPAPSATAAPTTAPPVNGILGDESFARRSEKGAPPAKEQSFAPTTTKRSSKGSVEKEPYAPAWEQTPELPEPPPTVQAVGSYKFRLTTHGETGLRDLAALAASLGGKLTDPKGKEIAPYMMETGETRTVKLMLPSVNAGAVAARLGEYGSIEIVNLPDRTLYASGATVPVVIEVTAP